jgi:ABC-2 type transport system ATP-binding protein
MVTIKNVTKKFGTKTVVDSLTVEIKAGEVFGLLGPNGAGKTTTINMIVGAIIPDTGSITVNGGVPGDVSVRRTIGIVPQTLAIYDSLTAYENLQFFGRLYGLEGQDLEENISRVLEIINLADRRKDKVKTYSEGMKRRLNIALALLHRPSFLILDEPTVGVDPQSRNAIFDTFRRLRDEHCTILLTSHYLEEAQQLCDSVAIMDEGKLLASAPVDEIVSRHGGLSILTVHTKNGRIRIETPSPVQEIIRINSEEEILSLKMESPSLEKAFLNVTGKQVRD